MLNNLFIDTDIILDILLNRPEFFDDSSAIFQKFENDEALLFTSTSIIINAQYVGQKQIGKDNCKINGKLFTQLFSNIGSKHHSS